MLALVAMTGSSAAVATTPPPPPEITSLAVHIEFDDRTETGAPFQRVDLLAEIQEILDAAVLAARNRPTPKQVTVKFVNAVYQRRGPDEALVWLKCIAGDLPPEHRRNLSADGVLTCNTTSGIFDPTPDGFRDLGYGNANLIVGAVLLRRGDEAATRREIDQLLRRLLGPANSGIRN
jgi:hypothetical protein